jgi:hypothetical protein
LQNLGHASLAIPLEKLLAQASSSQLLKQQTSVLGGFYGNSYWKHSKSKKISY